MSEYRHHGPAWHVGEILDPKSRWDAEEDVYMATRGDLLLAAEHEINRGTQHVLDWPDGCIYHGKL